VYTASQRNHPALCHVVAVVSVRLNRIESCCLRSEVLCMVVAIFDAQHAHTHAPKGAGGGMTDNLNDNTAYLYHRYSHHGYPPRCNRGTIAAAAGPVSPTVPRWGKLRRGSGDGMHRGFSRCSPSTARRIAARPLHCTHGTASCVPFRPRAPPRGSSLARLGG
jgi:hypothetical protein